MVLFIISFVAGVLTVLAPCVLPLLPVIIGGSVSGGKRDPYKAYIITASLAVSVVIFTLILKWSTAFIEISPKVWTSISASILVLIGLAMLFPSAWERLVLKLKLGNAGNRWLAQGTQKKSRAGDILIGAALGPVFSTCSPTYFVILATVLPESFAVGLVYLIAYATGLSVVLLLISILGQKFVSKLDKAADPHGWFKRVLGLLFIFVGVAIYLGADKSFEAFIIEKGIFDITKVENSLLEYVP